MPAAYYLSIHQCWEVDFVCTPCLYRGDVLSFRKGMTLALFHPVSSSAYQHKVGTMTYFTLNHDEEESDKCKFLLMCRDTALHTHKISCECIFRLSC